MSTKQLEVITAVGSDRPGLVSALSRLIHEANANLEDSRMAVLGGEFAIVVLYSGDEAAVAKVKETAKAAESELGLTLFFKSTQRNAPSGDARAYRLQVSGLDHPGIVHHITGILARHEVNVDSLDTEVVYAPMAGTPTFVMRANLRVPGSVPIARLRDALCDQCDEENLDLLLEARV